MICLCFQTPRHGYSVTCLNHEGRMQGPQTHSPAVDYSLFIMEMVEMLMEKVEASPAGPPVRGSDRDTGCHLEIERRQAAGFSRRPSPLVGRMTPGWS